MMKLADRGEYGRDILENDHQILQFFFAHRASSLLSGNTETRIC
jgi:hypothetical protein